MSGIIKTLIQELAKALYSLKYWDSLERYYSVLRTYYFMMPFNFSLSVYENYYENLTLCFFRDNLWFIIWKRLCLGKTWHLEIFQHFSQLELRWHIGERTIESWLWIMITWVGFFFGSAHDLMTGMYLGNGHGRKLIDLWSTWY